MSDAESSGGKTPLELKPSTLSMRHLHQVVGNGITYSFVHHNRHPHQNPFVSALGLSGRHGSLLIVLYDCVKDVLCYTQWFANGQLKKPRVYKWRVSIQWTSQFRAPTGKRVHTRRQTSCTQRHMVCTQTQNVHSLYLASVFCQRRHFEIAHGGI